MNNEQDFEDVYQRAKPKLQKYVARRVFGDSSEIVDEIFLTAWRRKADIPDDHEAQMMWLYAIGRRTIANSLRWHARLDLFNRTNTALVETSTSNNSSETTIFVHDCLSRLRKKDREILLLIEWDDFSINEAATILEITEAAVTKRLKQARDSFIALYSARSSDTY
jgi:RNA polymerase sigma-70 factor (ECF subfamily)